MMFFWYDYGGIITAIIAGILAVLLFVGIIKFTDHREEQRRLNPPTKCVLGYTMMRVGNSWVYQMKDNQQVPCK